MVLVNTDRKTITVKVNNYYSVKLSKSPSGDFLLVEYGGGKEHHKFECLPAGSAFQMLEYRISDIDAKIAIPAAFAIF